MKRPSMTNIMHKLVEIRFIESGNVALATQWGGDEWQVYQNGQRPTMMTLTPWGEVAERTGRRLLEDEAPLFLRPLYVPGPFYHGHWLYVDGWWLSGRYLLTNDWHEYLLSICGFTQDRFDYPQQFYKWIFERWPDGLFLHELEAAVVEEVSA